LLFVTLVSYLAAIIAAHIVMLVAVPKKNGQLASRLLDSRVFCFALGLLGALQTKRWSQGGQTRDLT